MLLVIDVGNTSTAFGVYEADRLVAHWRLGTDRHKSADEIGLSALQVFQFKGLNPARVTGAIISCVVPPVLHAHVLMCKEYFGQIPLILDHTLNTGLVNLYANPHEVGADRLANAVAVAKKHRLPAIVVDFGTATTIDAISVHREYLGGVIMPGIEISLEALFERASKLPRIHLKLPSSVLAKDTISSMQAGILLGAAGAVDTLVKRIQHEMSGTEEALIISTGGLGEVMFGVSGTIQLNDPLLTLDGLRYIFERNRPVL